MANVWSRVDEVEFSIWCRCSYRVYEKSFWARVFSLVSARYESV